MKSVAARSWNTASRFGMYLQSQCDPEAWMRIFKRILRRQMILLVFFADHQNVRRVFFNGQKAAQLFQRLVVLDGCDTARQFATLPSTSPAYASMAYEEKLRIWRQEISGTL